MRAFLSSLLASDTIPSRIICLNSGIYLTTEGSPVQDILTEFLQAGVAILSCGTCLDYYGRTEKLIIGQPTNMNETVAAMLQFPRVLTP
jgi:hypothetical protein